MQLSVACRFTLSLPVPALPRRTSTTDKSRYKYRPAGYSRVIEGSDFALPLPRQGHKLAVQILQHLRRPPDCHTDACGRESDSWQKNAATVRPEQDTLSLQPSSTHLFDDLHTRARLKSTMSAVVSIISEALSETAVAAKTVSAATSFNDSVSESVISRH